MFSRASIADWLEERTGYRTLVDHFKDPTPLHVHWTYTLGSVLLLLLVVQFVTGLAMMLYYVPTPTHAYDSVRYIVSQVPLGNVLRGLHYYGASFLVAIGVLHLLRALYFGAYKAPREFTWLSGFVLFVLLIAFGLTGYLLPWDQMGYWASVVRTNIAGTTPVVGPWVARLMKVGTSVGALTLSRWYALHVAVLPAALILFTVGHIYLVRRHGRAGHYVRLPRTPSFIAQQTARNIIAAAVMFGVLVGLAVYVRAPLQSMADPADFTFIPHPEWYFLWLFQLMKLGSNFVEQVGAPMILTLIIGFLVGLPFLDRTFERHPRQRLWVIASTAVGLAGIATLTVSALRDTPPDRDPDVWSPIAIAGQDIAGRKSCGKCHGPDSAAPDLSRGRVSHDNAWIRNHLSDPEAMAPGARPIPFDAPTKSDIVAVIAYQRMVRAGAPVLRASETERKVSILYATHCASCHIMDGDGIADGPDLTHAGRERDVGWIAKKIVDPLASDPKARMPSIEDKMSPEDVQIVARFLASRK